MPVIQPASSRFTRALEELVAMRWCAGMQVEEIGSPQRIAPYSVALGGELSSPGGNLLSSGRFILLHDPLGNDAWQGIFRIVSYTRAAVDLEMVADSLLPEVAWSWLTDALGRERCSSGMLAGTVTASYGRSFGQMSDEADKGEVEVRASWTPQLDDRHPLDDHLLAWQDLLRAVAGAPPTTSGVTSLIERMRR